MIFGVQYYPEHWPEERWPLDASLMQRAGVNTVRAEYCGRLSARLDSAEAVSSAPKCFCSVHSRSNCEVMATSNWSP